MSQLLQEAKPNEYWLVDGLKAAGFTVHLANTTAIKKYEGLKHTLLEKRLQGNMKERSEYGLLTSVPGIGQVLATTILLETGPIDRFAGAGNYPNL